MTIPGGISVSRLTCSYASRPPVLQALDLSVAEGQLAAIVGRSAAGKSTLIRVLAGCLSENTTRVSGEVLLGGLSPRVVRQNAPGAIAVSFQEPVLLPFMSVRQNVAFPAHCARITTNEQSVEEALALVGLSDVGDDLPYTLSGGMKARLVLASLLVVRPRFLFLDEPFSSLDFGWRLECYQLLQLLRRSSGCTTVLVTHDTSEAVLLAETVSIMNAQGRLELAGVGRGGTDVEWTADGYQEALRPARDLQTSMLRELASNDTGGLTSLRHTSTT